MIDRLSQVLGAYRDNKLEAVVIKNGFEHPVLYSVEAMNFEEIQDFLKNLNKETLKIKIDD